ncbi:MAG: hypothetical protein ACI31R_00910 [Bacilli bacterium]
MKTIFKIYSTFILLVIIMCIVITPTSLCLFINKTTGIYISTAIFLIILCGLFIIFLGMLYYLYKQYCKEK